MITIRGKHNLSKGLSLKFLSNRKALGDYLGSDVTEIARKTGISKDYLQHRLPYWAEWDLINAKSKRIKGKGRRLYYSILSGGRDWINSLPADQIKMLDLMLFNIEPKPGIGVIKKIFGGLR